MKKFEIVYKVGFITRVKIIFRTYIFISIVRNEFKYGFRIYDFISN